MGSHSDYIHTAHPHETMREAFDRLRDECGTEEGRNAYNGTIYTARGVRLAPVPHALTLAEAKKVAQGRIDSLRKWDVYEAIPLATVTPASIADRKHHTVTLTVPADTVNAKGWDASPTMRRRVARELGVKPRQVITTTAARYEASKWATKTVTTPGKAVTRYVATTRNGTKLGAFATLTEAKKAKPELANVIPGLRYGIHPEPQTIRIAAVREREDGQPLAETTVTTTHYTVTLNITTGTVKTPEKIDRATRSGWFFYGWAAC